MRLGELALSGFRNLADTELELPPGGLAVLGDNAQGKSNFLEAIYYLEALRSFRGTPDADLVRFGEETFRLVGRLGPAGGREAPAHVRGAEAVREVAAAFRRSPRAKRVSLDGRPAERLADGVGRIGAVVFSPADLRMVTDGPSERRQFLDVLLSLNERAYLSALQRFRQALAQRNAALREGAPEAAVRVWDDGLVRFGAAVAAARARWLREAEGDFEEYYRTVSEGEAARLEYEPGIPGAAGEASETEIGEAFRRALAREFDRERRRGTTLVGPQRDEFRMFVTERSGGDERDVRAYGSGGQRRTAALALRLLEADAVRARRGREPLLLLDDVFAELDEGRARRVLELLDRTAVGQVILTAPRRGDLRFREGHLPVWTIRDGRFLS